MVKEKTYEWKKGAESKGGVGESWAQGGYGSWGNCAQTGTGEREGHRLSQPRGGAFHTQQFQQSVTHCRGKTQPPGRVHGRESLQVAALVCFLALMAGCGGHKRPEPGNVPAPPAASTPTPRPTPRPSATPTPVPGRANIPTPAAPPEITLPKDAKVLYSEVGYASWYGPRFQKRQAANGQAYDMDGMTAAHRTLPLNSIARVTDVKTGDSVLLRITDPGPFVNDRIL